MARVLTDSYIGTLLGETKPLPSNWVTRLRTRSKSNMAFSQRDLSLTAPSGHEFNLVLRTSSRSPLDFSVILVYAEDSQEYILRRNNGPHPSRHTNHWEKKQGQPNYRFEPCFHIHMATERYQQPGLHIDGYAQPTDKFQDFSSALRLLLTDCNFVVPDNRRSQIGFPTV